MTINHDVSYCSCMYSAALDWLICYAGCLCMDGIFSRMVELAETAELSYTNYGQPWNTQYQLVTNCYIKTHGNVSCGPRSRRATP